MATYYYQKIRCPHCGYYVGRRSGSGKPPKQNEVTYYGCPICRCGYCQKLYSDSNCRERACQAEYGVKFSDKMIISVSAIFFALFATFGAIVFIFASSESKNEVIKNLKYIGFLAPIAILVGSGLRYRKRKSSLNLEIAESIARLSYLDYALVLKKAGFNVPKMYINPDSNDKKLLEVEKKDYHVNQFMVERAKMELIPLLYPQNIKIEKTMAGNARIAKKETIDGWECPICGNINEKFTKVCSSCKYDVNPNGWVCPICGVINDESTTICECGYEDF